MGTLTRREVLARGSLAALAAVVAGARPAAAHLLPGPPVALGDPLADPTLQAFADTMIPGRRATKTDLGNPIDPRSIAGVDPLPGAVEADALALYHHPEVGFD